MNTQPLNVQDNAKGMFNTYTGVLVNINQPDPAMINTRDIAHGLSNICRFGGHTNLFYSVAAHSLLVAALAPANLKLEALLHDATEAYLGDVIKPLKNVLGEAYSTIETKFEAVIASRYAIKVERFKEIKDFDIQALELENLAFKHNDSAVACKIFDLINRETGTKYGAYQHDNYIVRDVFAQQVTIYQSDRSLTIMNGNNE